MADVELRVKVNTVHCNAILATLIESGLSHYDALATLGATISLAVVNADEDRDLTTAMEVVKIAAQDALKEFRTEPIEPTEAEKKAQGWD